MRKYFLIIICAILIFVASVIDVSAVGRNSFLIPHLDKIFHFLMYFSLSIICAYKIGLHSILNRLFVLLFPIFYGGFVELFQHYISLSRTGDWFDFLFNVLGSFTGISIFLLLGALKNE